jgi:hypothetical protein
MSSAAYIKKFWVFGLQEVARQNSLDGVLQNIYYFGRLRELGHVGECYSL